MGYFIPVRWLSDDAFQRRGFLFSFAPSVQCM